MALSDESRWPLGCRQLRQDRSRCTPPEFVVRDPDATSDEFAYARSIPWECGPVFHSGLMLAARITLPHFFVSSAMSLPKSAAEPGSTVPPTSLSCALIVESVRLPALKFGPVTQLCHPLARASTKRAGRGYG